MSLKAGYDPAQLLRRSWEGDTDALAQELYVILSQGVRPAGPARNAASARALAELARKSSATERPAPIARSTPGPALPRPIAASAPARSSVQPSRPEPHRTPAPELPAPNVAPPPPLARSAPPDRLELGSMPSASSSTSRSPAVAPRAPAGPAEANRRRPLANPTPPGARPDVQAPASAPRPIAISQPVATHDTSFSASSHPGQIPTPVLPAAPALAASFVPNAVVLARLQPAAAPEARAGREPEAIETRHIQSAEPGRKPTAIPLDRLGRLSPLDDLDFDQRAVGYITSAGVTALTLSTSSSSVATPGYGQAYFLDFDGSVLSYFSKDPVDVYSLSRLPLGGNAIWPIERYGEYFWLAHRPALGHGIITAQIGPASGLTTGSGQVQLYYYSGGSMVATGSVVTVENWYAVTGAVGKHCGIMEVDGTLSLEILEC